MRFVFEDKQKYKDILLYHIADNQNGLPFFTKKIDLCGSLEHRHEYIQLVYVLKGKLKHVMEDSINDLCCGDILVIPPYHPHYFISSPDKPFELIEFEFIPSFIEPRLDEGLNPGDSDVLAWLEPYADSDAGLFPRASLNGVIRYEVEDVLNEVIKEYYLRRPGFEVVIRALAMKLFVQIRREIGRNESASKPEVIYERHRDSLQRSLEFIKGNYTRDISIEDAANVAIMSPSYYRHYFKLLTKKTFTEYLNSLRIARAAELIKTNPDKKVLEICFETGFNNISHFNRTFLKITGVTPKTFRQGSDSVKTEDII